MSSYKLIHWNENRIDEILASIKKRIPVEIKLPSNFNHSLYRKFHPNQDTTVVEKIEQENGIELLNRIAEVPGLEAFSRLTTADELKQATIRISSPPAVTIDFQE